MIAIHRVNSSEQLRTIPEKYGVEVDLRDFGNEIILNHEPYEMGEKLIDYLKNYNHAFIILNIKSEGIEYKVLELMKQFNIKNYFFLDSSFPMIIKLLKKGEINVAVRFSEYESFSTIKNVNNYPIWVWSDFFSKNCWTSKKHKMIKKHGMKLCVVSPELQNKHNKINRLINFYNKNKIQPDMVCTKLENAKLWEKLFQMQP